MVSWMTSCWANSGKATACSRLTLGKSARNFTKGSPAFRCHERVHGNTGAGDDRYSPEDVVIPSQDLISSHEIHLPDRDAPIGHLT